jgi:hypothetical protein
MTWRACGVKSSNTSVLLAFCLAPARVFLVHRLAADHQGRGHVLLRPALVTGAVHVQPLQLPPQRHPGPQPDSGIFVGGLTTPMAVKIS